MLQVCSWDFVHSGIIFVLVDADYMKLKRKVFWYEEQLMKYVDYDKLKTRNTDLLRQKERLQIELKDLEKKLQAVRDYKIAIGFKLFE